VGSRPVVASLTAFLLFLSDASVYRAGQAVHVKGYVRRQGDAAVVKGTLRLRAHWPRDMPAPEYAVGPGIVAMDGSGELSEEDQDQDQEGQRVEQSGEWGSFHATLRVPADAKPGQASLELLLDGRFVHSLAVTVSDPRPPTVQLQLRTEPADRAKPFFRLSEPGGIQLAVVAQTATGAPVAQASVTVKWRADSSSGSSWDSVQPAPACKGVGVGAPASTSADGSNADRPGSDGSGQGTTTVLTGEDGIGVFAIPVKVRA
jgi:uncharacterized protein YfaS (alpha-2-macroglobulin family)